MANKLKNFLFPVKDKNEFDSTTVVVKKDEIIKPKTNSVSTNRPNIVTPKTFSQVEEISNQLLDGVSVIVDLTSTEISEAKRICDFLNGVTFALNGKVEKIAKLVYMFTPNN